MAQGQMQPANDNDNSKKLSLSAVEDSQYLTSLTQLLEEGKGWKTILNHKIKGAGEKAQRDGPHAWHAGALDSISSTA